MIGITSAMLSQVSQWCSSKEKKASIYTETAVRQILNKWNKSVRGLQQMDTTDWEIEVL